MQNLKTQSLVLFLSTLCLLTGAHAQFTPSDDSNTDSLASKTTNGNKVTLEVVNETGEGATAIDTAFIRFDLTAVPATYTGTSVAKATLKLFVHSVTKAGSFNVNLVNGTWAEATIDLATSQQSERRLRPTSRSPFRTNWITWKSTSRRQSWIG